MMDFTIRMVFAKNVMLKNAKYVKQIRLNVKLAKLDSPDKEITNAKLNAMQLSKMKMEYVSPVK